MAFADTLGAVATFANLAPGLGTTTIESKTNFFAPALVGSIVTGRYSTPSRPTHPEQTRLTNPEGRLLAQITQTQLVLRTHP
ncbi:MAG: hypothetical protein U0232_14770 [Thermomicrobiales bacterium]